MNRALINNVISELGSNCDVHKDLKITNIKISLKYEKPLRNLELLDDHLHYYTKHVFVLKFASYTCTILNKAFDSVNLTGIPNPNEVLSCLLTFEKICESVNIIDNNLIKIKIYTISTTFNSHKNLKYYLTSSNLKKYLIQDNCLSIRKIPSFAGLLLRRNGANGTYFNSGRIITTGTVTVAQTNNYFKFLQNFFDYVNHYKDQL